MLGRGSKGKAVRKVQEMLAKKGFSPGKIDGDFGKATRSAVVNFQKSEGLLADGIVGPKTIKALFSKRIPGEIKVGHEDITARITPEFVAKLFHSSSRVKKNINK